MSPGLLLAEQHHSLNPASPMSPGLLLAEQHHSLNPASPMSPGLLLAEQHHSLNPASRAPNPRTDPVLTGSTPVCRM